MGRKDRRNPVCLRQNYHNVADSHTHSDEVDSSSVINLYSEFANLISLINQVEVVTGPSGLRQKRAM